MSSEEFEKEKPCNDNCLVFHHGGRIGDCLYAMYTVRKICERDNKKACIRLSLYHGGSWNINTLYDIVDFLLTQPFVCCVKEYTLPENFWEGPLNKDEHGVDYDLHAPERKYNPKDFPLYDSSYGWPGNVNLAERTATYFGIEYDPDETWLDFPSDSGRPYFLPEQSDYVVVHATKRRMGNRLTSFTRLPTILDDRYNLKTIKVRCSNKDSDDSLFEDDAFLTGVVVANYSVTYSLVGLARVLKDALGFIMTCNAPFVLARGLGVPGLVEIESVKECHNNYPLPYYIQPILLQDLRQSRMLFLGTDE